MQGKVSKELQDRLKAILRQHLVERQLEAGKRHGSVNRTYYRVLVGLNWWDRFAEIEAIFDEFQAEVTQLVEAETLSVEQAEAWLVERYNDRSLNNGRRDRVSRRQFCDHFGIEYLRLIEIQMPEIAELLVKWDTKLRDERYSHDPANVRAYKIAESREPYCKRPSLFINRHAASFPNLRERLQAALQQDYEAGTLVLQRAGVISRTHYGNLLTGDPSDLIHYIPIFKHFESFLGGEEMRFEHEIEEMERWLRQQLLEGKIKITRYKFDRGPFIERYGVSRGLPRHILDRNPLIYAMWQRIDEDVAKGRIKSATKEEKLARFRRALEKAPLNPDGLKINRPYLEQEAGLGRWEIRAPEYADAIEQEEEWRLAELLKDPQRAYINGKVYDFRPLAADGWRDEVIVAVRDAFFNVYREQQASYLKGVRLTMLEVLSGLSTGTSPAAKECFRSVNERFDIAHSTWSAFLAEFGDKYVEDVENQKTGRTYIAGVNAVLATLGNAGVLPRTDVVIRSKEKPGGHLKNFAEIQPAPNQSPMKETDPEPPSPPDEERYEEHVQYAKWRLLQLRRPGEEQRQVEDEAFFDGLRAELKGANIPIPNDPVQALVQVLELRLRNFERPFIQEIKTWRAHYEKGERLLSRARLPDGYMEKIEQADTGQRRPFTRSLFPNEPLSERGTANLLQYVMEQHNGFFPSPEESGLGASFYGQLCAAYGGIEHLQAYLIPHRNAVGSCICLYLAASGANLAVGRGLDAEAIEKSDEPGFVKVTGAKVRAQGKPIIVELREDSFVVETMKWLASDLDLARFNAPNNIDGLLFLRRVGNKIVKVTSPWLGTWFREFKDKDEELSRYPITLNMTRPTVLLLHALRNDGNLRIGLAYAQHGENVAGIYQIREATKYLYERKWRQFQDAKETLIIWESEVALQKFIADENEKNERIDRLMKTGLGSYCRVGGCNAMHCFSCPSSALIANPDDMADLQIWNEALKEAEGEWIRDKVERWEAEWLPWQCYTEVIAEKMQDGGKGFRLIWREATKIAAFRKSQPDFVPPRPY
ncbi:hypothetical protein GR223_23415 [Rhizobium leguminosarum]|uniref:hypothetical protein n=1 Tax=Rhizobium ruizarguesonis TaxID=2081791 RepID=UPI0013DFF95D|nr:hypothetical protein [Rhizobium ruizarguesonis]NEJ88846.1 hypothetical protein [Rhizobium ruizarguesonis]